VLFEPELGVDYQVSDRTSVEATWAHIPVPDRFRPGTCGFDIAASSRHSEAGFKKRGITT
jgi:hypothetical protein